jgi:hypothetical protein
MINDSSIKLRYVHFARSSENKSSWGCSRVHGRCGVNCRGKMTDIIFVIRPSRREARAVNCFNRKRVKPPRRRRSRSRNPSREIARDGNFVGTPLSKLSQLCQFANCRLAYTSACHSAIVIKLYDARNEYLYICLKNYHARKNIIPPPPRKKGKIMLISLIFM